MSDENSNQYPLGEPSVLDYIKSLFHSRNGERIRIPSFVEEEPRPVSFVLPQPEASSVEVEGLALEQTEPAALVVPPSTPFPWRSLLAFGVAFVAQKTFEPPHTSTGLGVILYVVVLSLLGWGLFHNELNLAPLAPTAAGTDPLTYRGLPLVIAIPLGLIAFFVLNNNLFTKTNVAVWLLAVLSLIWAFWLSRNPLRNALRRFGVFLRREAWTINISRWTLLLLAATALIVFFRFTQTLSVPPEPFSDHAEKILDVYDVSQGQTHIFFPRNTGREGFQMYWTLLIARIFGTGLSFLSLKLGTAFLGFFTLPFIYLLGKEIGGRRVGLIAFLMAGIGYWPNVISRVGLRFPLYPLFAAPTLFFLIRGLRTRNRNDFILSGLFLGIGLHGYSPMRIVPFVVLAAFLIYWLHSQSKGARRELLVWLAILTLVSLFVFLPLLRYWYENPASFGFRAFTRLEGVEQPLPGPAYQIFFSNLWNALRMFNYDDGEIWVHSVTHRPALDIVGAALFLIGVVLVLVRYLRNRHWLDLFLLVSIPLLLMPSILSLAFPGENPALNRAGAAYIPAILIGALALDGLLTSLGRGGMRTVLTWGLASILFLVSASQNYDLVFHQYYTSFRNGSWNSSDMGKVIKEFQQTYGRTDTVWIVPFPYWVDTRLPGVWAGIPNRDMAMWRENLASTVEFTGPKMFIVKADPDRPEANDQESLDILEALYPNGQLRMFDSDIDGHDFWIFTVPSN